MRTDIQPALFCSAFASCLLLLSGVFVTAQTPPAAPQPPVAPTPADLTQVYAGSMAAFQQGDYVKAATELEGLVAKAEFTPQLEPIFFTIGSAYFNAGNAAKATQAFKTYQAKFPNGVHAADVAFALGQCSVLTKNLAEAETQFTALQNDPRLREQVLLALANVQKEAGKTTQAAATLEKMSGGELRNAAGVRGAMMLAQTYVQQGAAEKAVQTINRIHDQIGLVDNLVELNAMTVDLGDQLFAKKSYAAALDAYRAAYPRDQLVSLQNKRIVVLQRSIEENLNAVRADPSKVGQLGTANNQIKADIAKAQSLLVEFQKLPDVTSAIYVRMGRCFQEADQKWEAVVVYQELLDRFPSAAEREPSLFGMILALADVNQPEKAMKRCEDYLRDFPTGPNAATVGYLLGAVALQANDPRAAETYFGKMLETQATSPYREQMRYLLANAKFSGGKYDEAVTEYRKYLSEYPKGTNVEEVNYRLALTALFAGNYEDAIKQLNAHLKAYPQGAFVSDARYRLAVCKYAASLYEEVITDCKAWERDYKGNAQLGEVLALLADAYEATGKPQEAIPIYIRAYQAASTEEVLNYSLFAASKLLQKNGEWSKVSDLFTGFIKEKPDHPSVMTALYWIGKAKAKEGQIDEAKRITADTIKQHIGNPKREATEMLLTQLAQLCVRKNRPEVAPVAAETPEAGAPGQGSNAPTDVVSVPSPPSETTPPPEPQGDPGVELDLLLGEAGADQSPTAKARILFAKAELARLRRQPADEEKNIGLIASTSKPEDLSPVLLGRVGDYLVTKRKPDQARPFYERLMEEFPKSDNVDYAYNGLGEIAFQKNDLPRALRYFTDGTDKIAAAEKLKDITVGKAKTLLALGRLVEARQTFQAIAEKRDWRGESTAFSVYSLGEIEARQGRWAEANAYFQRVYIGYQKFLPWVARAYMRSAESFEKLGKTQEAANTYRELLRLAEEKKEVAAFAETQEARKKLEAMGQG